MIAFILDQLLGPFLPYLAAAGAALVGLAGFYFKGRSAANAKRDVRDLKGFKDTTERMQDAEAAMGDDPTALRDWLRGRDPEQR